MKILVFLHGTTIMHKHGMGQKREDIVKQVIEHEESVLDYVSYVPVGDAVEKLRNWEKGGAEIIYLSSHENSDEVEKDKFVLRKYGFPKGEVFFRQKGEEYKDVAERIKPDIIIEDDCESIGGEIEMTYPHIKPELKAKIRLIVVKEFEGIDHLPNNLEELQRF